jgi:outer membrane protein assembly factor BamB
MGRADHFRNAFVLTRFASIALLSALCLGCLRASAEDWPKYKRDLANDGLSAETGINSTNVSSLQTKWTFPTGGIISASPAVATVNGISTVYLGSWTGVFYAVNAVTGQSIWTFQVDKIGPCKSNGCHIGSSAAVDVANNLVFFGARNAYVYALNAATGQLVWKQRVGSNPYEIWSSPAIYNGMLFVGVSSHGDDPCIPGGQVNAYNELTGAPVWSFNTIDQTTCPSGVCVGGSVWSSVAIDDVNGIVYADTGNPGSTCFPPSKNAALYPDSVLALSAASGTLLNYYQAIDNDNNDKDFGSSPILHTASETNQCTSTTTTTYWVTAANKNAHVFTLQRDAKGLTGTVYDNETLGLGFIETPSIRTARTISPCNSTGGHIIDHTNYLDLPNSNGVFWQLAQTGLGVTTILKKVILTPGMAFYSAPAVIQDIVIFGGDDNKLHVLGEHGHQLATFSIGSPIYSGIAISNGRIYFGATDGTIYCMSINGQ